MNEPHSAHEHPAVHGMLIVGTSNVFLSHLPMFHAPHDYQAIFEVTLSEQGTDATAIYQEDRRTSGERVYTWVPKPFALPSLFHLRQGGAADAGHDFSRALRARRDADHVGSRARGGHACAVRPQVHPVRCATVTPAVSAVRHDDEPFVAHVITRPPDYDQILSITMPQPPFGWDGTSVVLEFPIGRTRMTSACAKAMHRRGRRAGVRSRAASCRAARVLP